MPITILYDLQQLCDEAGSAAKEAVRRTGADRCIRHRLFDHWWADHPVITEISEQLKQKTGDPVHLDGMGNYENGKGEKVRRVWSHHTITTAWNEAMEYEIATADDLERLELKSLCNQACRKEDERRLEVYDELLLTLIKLTGWAAGSTGNGADGEECRHLGELSSDPKALAATIAQARALVVAHDEGSTTVAESGGGLYGMDYGWIHGREPHPILGEPPELDGGEG